jgi:hypothetical protein
MNDNNDDNINFLLDMKNNIDDFLHFFNDYLIQIDNIKTDFKNDDKYIDFINMYNRNVIRNKIQNIHSLIKKINIKICKDCSHEFIEDYIDDFLDRTQKITYCNICCMNYH